MDKGSAKERLIIKLVCVLLSFCLWIYVTNVETIVKTFTLKNVPVQIVNTEALKNYGLALSPGQEFDVNLNLEGPAKYIYSINKSDFTIRADLSEYALKKGENNIPVQIINYPQEVNIKNNGYLIVKVKLEALETKSFKAVSEVNLEFAQDVYKDSVDYTPENIDVSGPASAVNQVAKVALVGTLKDISEPMTKSFKYEPLNANGQVVKDVELNKTSATISISTNQGKKVPIVAQFTGKLPDGVNLVSTELSQNYVTITGDKQALGAVKSINTEPIDLTQIAEDTTKKVKLILPNGVSTSEGNNTITVNIDISKQNDNTNNNNNNNNENNNNNNNNNENEVNINKSLNIPLTYTGLQSGLKVENIPSVLTIQLTGTKEMLNGISENDFTAVADLSSYKEEGTFDLTPKVTTDKNIKISSIPNVNVVLSKAEVVSSGNKKKRV